MAKKTKKIDKIWLNSYPEGVQPEIGELEYSSVAALLEDSCKKFPSNPAFTCMGKTITYSDNMLQSFPVSCVQDTRL